MIYFKTYFNDLAFGILVLDETKETKIKIIDRL